MHYLSSSSGLCEAVGFAKLDIAGWTVGTMFKFCPLLIAQGGHWLVFGQNIIYSDMLKIEIGENESIISPSLQTQGSSLLYSGKDETVRQQNPLGTCVSINFVVCPASISPFSRKLSKSAKMANGTFI